MKKKNKQFSRTVTAFLVVNTVLMNWASLATMIYLANITAISYYITGANTALSIVMGFYFYKAKSENVLKIGSSLEPETALSDGFSNGPKNLN